MLHVAHVHGGAGAAAMAGPCARPVRPAPAPMHPRRFLHVSTSVTASAASSSSPPSSSSRGASAGSSSGGSGGKAGGAAGARPKVVVVGGGWAGFGAAYAALQSGADVTVLDAAEQPGGLSSAWRTPGGQAVEPGIKG